MKRLFGIFGGGLGLLILLGLGAALFFSLRSINPSKGIPLISQAASSPTLTQSKPTAVPLATATQDVGAFQSPLPRPAEPTLTPVSPPPYQPPVCKFEKNVTAAPAAPSRLNKFTFSEPKVIFSREAPIELIEWLPDNQHLLVHVRNQIKQSIEALDTTTGQTQVYAANLQNANLIHWIAAENAVVYTDNKTQEFSGVDQYGVWLSRGQGQQPQLLLKDANQLQTGASAKQLPTEVAQMFNVSKFPFDPERWRYNKFPQDQYVLQSWSEIEFASSVSPDGSKAVFYGVPWLYLVDLKTNQPCEVDLGKYMQTYYTEQGPLRVFDASWSPDGRLLAMRITVGYRGELMRFNKLIVLNTVTGELYRPEIKGSHVWDVEWFPDSRYLVVMGYSDETEHPQLNQQIGIIDSMTQEFRLMLPNQVFAQGSQAGFQLALSPNGKKLTINCPIISDKYSLGLKGQVCFIQID